MSTPIFGALALIISNPYPRFVDTRVLCVTRRDRPLDFALPCGKVDPGETPIQTAYRELKEETGVVAPDLTPIYVEEVVPNEPIQVFYSLTHKGTIRIMEPGITPIWLPFSYLEGEQCTYREFSRRLRIRMSDIIGVRL